MTTTLQTDGPFVEAFGRNYIIQTKGRWAGKPLEFEPWQRDLLRELYIKDSRGNYVYREALIGVPRKNGKSTLASSLGLYALLASGETGAEVYAAAASRDQARIVFNQAVDFIEASPLLQDWLKPQRSVIICEATGSRFRVLSSDGPLQHGLNPSLVVIDELWAHPNAELYYALTTGQLARENPLVVSISTAGHDTETICHQVYERGRNLKTREAQRKARFLFIWHQAPDGCDLDDTKAWREANPSRWIKISDLRRERERLPENVFRRLHLNQWTESEEAWLPYGAWEACEEPGAEIPEGARVTVGVDVGTMKDSSAVVCCWKRDDDKVVVAAEIFAPKGEGTALELATIDAAIYRVAEKYRIDQLVYDRWAFERQAQDFEDRGLKVIQVPMHPDRLAPYSLSLYEAVVEKRIVHNGDPALTAHVNAGAVKQHERGWRLVKGKSSRPIDALMALCIAFGVQKETRKLQPVVEWLDWPEEES